MPEGIAENRRKPIRALRKAVFSVVAILMVIVIVEGLCSLILGTRDALRVWSPSQRLRERVHAAYDPDLGWVNTPSTHIENLYGQGLDLSINALGFRGPEVDPSHKRYRVVCLGDSFTLGYGVGDNETYPAAWAKRNPEVETINMGQGGYGLGQAMLWFERDGLPLRPNLVILGYINHDIERLTWPSYLGVPKPTFHVERGRLVIDNQPVPPKPGIDLGRIGLGLRRFAMGRATAEVVGLDDDSAQSVWVRQSADIQTAALIIKRLHERCVRAGVKLGVVHLPVYDELVLHERAPYSLRAVEALRQRLQPDHIPFLNLVPNFERLPARELRRAYLAEPYHHMSRSGNAMVAEAVRAWAGTLDSNYPD